MSKWLDLYLRDKHVYKSCSFLGQKSEVKIIKMFKNDEKRHFWQSRKIDIFLTLIFAIIYVR